MARARNLKPSFFTNDLLGEIEPLGRLLFAGLWTLADREGRLDDRPKRIKAELLPYDDGANVDALLNELQRRGFILRYEYGDRALIQILAFKKHQNPHVKEPASTIPAPDLHCANPEPAPKNPERAGRIPSNGFPQPDSSGGPSDLLSGKPDIAGTKPDAKAEKLRSLRAEAVALIDFLNVRTGKAYQHVPANVDPIVGLLKAGATTVQIRQVIVSRARKWHGDPKMEEYLRPKTLFNRTNFANYVGELVEQHDPEPAHEGGSA